MTEAAAFDQVATARFAARAEELKSIRRLVRIAAPACGFDAPLTEDIALAVCEAVENIIQHAYGPTRKGDIVMRFFRESEGIRVEIQDFADRVDPESIRPRALEDIRPGGLGTHFIGEIMDEAVMGPGPDEVGNLLTMRKSWRPQT